MERDATCWHGNEPLVDKLVDRGARFIVIGGTALRWHVPERPVGQNDLDLLVSPDPADAELVASVLAELRVSALGWAPARLAEPGNRHVRLYDRGLYADLLTRPALAFETHWTAARSGRLFGHPIRVAAPELLWEMIKDSSEPKHDPDREILRGLLSPHPG